jgi:putative transposase
MAFNRQLKCSIIFIFGVMMVLIGTRYSSPWLRHVFADGGYAGDKLKTGLTEAGDWTAEVIKRSGLVKGFVVLPRRWVVKHTFVWLNQTGALPSTSNKPSPQQRHGCSWSQATRRCPWFAKYQS